MYGFITHNCLSHQSVLFFHFCYNRIVPCSLIKLHNVFLELCVMVEWQDNPALHNTPFQHGKNQYFGALGVKVLSHPVYKKWTAH